MSDLINRQDAIKNAHFPVIDDASYEVVRVDDILALPSAELTTNLQPSCNQLATDLISRQDAIDAFGLSEKTRKYGGDHSGYDTMMLYEIQDVLESLPSADKKQVTGKLKNRDDSFLTADAEAVKERKSKLDLISRQDAFRTYQVKVCHDVACSECQMIEADGTCRIEAWLKDLPSADKPKVDKGGGEDDSD